MLALQGLRLGVNMFSSSFSVTSFEAFKVIGRCYRIVAFQLAVFNRFSISCRLNHFGC